MISSIKLTELKRTRLINPASYWFVQTGVVQRGIKALQDVLRQQKQTVLGQKGSIKNPWEENP